MTPWPTSVRAEASAISSSVEEVQRAERLAVACAVHVGAAGREPERAGGDAVRVTWRSISVSSSAVGDSSGSRTALAHHVGAQRRVGHLRTDVHREPAPSERVEVVGEASPSPT